MFKQVLSSAFTFVTLFAPAAALSADNWDYCETKKGLHMCGTVGEQSDRFRMSGHGFTVDMNIRCTIDDDNYYYSWEVNKVHGVFSKEDARYVANHYCQGRLDIDPAEAETEVVSYPMA